MSKDQDHGLNRVVESPLSDDRVLLDLGIGSASRAKHDADLAMTYALKDQACPSASSSNVSSDAITLDIGVESSLESEPDVSSTPPDVSTEDSCVFPLLEDSSVTPTLAQRMALHMAQNACICFFIALSLSMSVSVVGMVIGDFSVSVDNAGYQSRGTLIGDRHAQFILTHLNRYKLWSDTNSSWWTELQTKVQPGWEVQDTSEEEQPGTGTRKLNSVDQPEQFQRKVKVPFTLIDQHRRKLQSASATEGSLLEGCPVDWYGIAGMSDRSLTVETRLWPIWKARPTMNMLDVEQIRDLCLTEEITQQVLVDNDLCIRCESADKNEDSPRCLLPYSLVFFARLQLENGFSITCDEVADGWGRNIVEQGIVYSLVDCAASMDSEYALDDPGTFPDNCPPEFLPFLFDDAFQTTASISYSSSIFATPDSSDVDVDIGTVTQELFDLVPQFSRGVTDANFIGAYDTQYEDFVLYQADVALIRDMSLAVGSAVVTYIAINVHTRSPFLSFVGLLQIVLSFPVSYFVYKMVLGFNFFPFLNFIGIFVVCALGADDIFVTVDKWKNARIKFSNGPQVLSTHVIASYALPDAAGAMFLTTVTTAIAFFGTAVCPVAPIRLFGIFCGLLIVFDYVMCIILVFPALCLYDRLQQQRQQQSGLRHVKQVQPQQQITAQGPVPSASLIHIILNKYYRGIHMLRWPLVSLSFVAFALAAFVGAGLRLPNSSDVRILDESHQFEQSSQWRTSLLYDVLDKKDGSKAYIMFGVTPADTGALSDPTSLTQLVLDEDFVPSDRDAQAYLLDFCDRLFDNDWATPTDPSFVCPINRFHVWLQTQSQLIALGFGNETDVAYRSFCNGATSLPMPPHDFDSCIYAWGQQESELFILADGVKTSENDNGEEGGRINPRVRIMYIPFNSRVRYDSSFDELDKEWHLIERWMEKERGGMAPSSIASPYHTSDDFWFYDTNGRMLDTVYTAGTIAICTAAVVILLSSQSFVLTIFSALTIAFILASTTACLVFMGWTLGFLESICFAILIGISCDFVIHFSHAYAHLPGDAGRGERTQFALITMGPSVLAAAATTISAATIMLFTTITFFQKFAVILFLTIVMSTLGSFVVFLVLADTFGPTQPTYTFDRIKDLLSRAQAHHKPSLQERQQDNTVRRNSGLVSI